MFLHLQNYSRICEPFLFCWKILFVTQQLNMSWKQNETKLSSFTPKYFSSQLNFFFISKIIFLFLQDNFFSFSWNNFFYLFLQKKNYFFWHLHASFVFQSLLPGAIPIDMLGKHSFIFLKIYSYLGGPLTLKPGVLVTVFRNFKWNMFSLQLEAIPNNKMYS